MSTVDRCRRGGDTLDDSAHFLVHQSLPQQDLFRCNGLQESGQAHRRYSHLRGGLLPSFAYLFSGDLELAFRAPAEGGVILGVAWDPRPVHVDVHHTHVIRIIADRETRAFNVRMPERLGPVGDVMELHPAARRHFGGAFHGRGERVHHKVLIIGNRPLVTAVAPRCDPGGERVARAVAEGWMREGLIDIVGPCT
jgi:hypothetical protein